MYRKIKEIEDEIPNYDKYITIARLKQANFGKQKWFWWKTKINSYKWNKKRHLEIQKKLNSLSTKKGRMYFIGNVFYRPFVM